MYEGGIHSHLGVRESSLKRKLYANGEEGGVSQCESSHIMFFIIEHLVHKLHRVITRFFVSFVKILVLLKLSVAKTYFAANFKTVTNATQNSVLWVASVLDTPIVKLCLYFCYFYFFCFLRNCWHKQKQPRYVFWLKRFP